MSGPATRKESDPRGIRGVRGHAAGPFLRAGGEPRANAAHERLAVSTDVSAGGIRFDTTTTNPKGKYSFGDLPLGIYAVEVPDVYSPKPADLTEEFPTDVVDFP